jgi:hypothetical protein
VPETIIVVSALPAGMDAGMLSSGTGQFTGAVTVMEIELEGPHWLLLETIVIE